jgi:flagellar hook-basal body complex protein FliE
MKISDIELGKQYLPLVQQQNQANAINTDDSQSFVNTLKEFIGDVNSQQIEAGNKVESFIKGEPIDIHDVMISVEKSKTSFQLLLELRNRFLDLYREVDRLQV